MKHRVAELEGALLDAAVALAECLDGALRDWDGNGTLVFQLANGFPYRPSTDWVTGGPIIERERIEILSFRPGEWEAQVAPREPCHYIDQGAGEATSGPSPLIAAMRAFVASRFGDEVDLPTP